MKPAVLLGFAFVFAATTSVAQSGATPSVSQQSAPATTDFVLYLPAPTCPVTMRALQGTGTGLVAVRADQRAAGFSQRIHLILTNPTSAKIAAAHVRVFGLSARNRIVQASYGALDLTNQTNKYDLTRTLNVTFTPEGEQDVATDLILPGFTTVLSIQLESLTYKDGSTWAVAGRQACHVAPNPLMLVAGR